MRRSSWAPFQEDASKRSWWGDTAPANWANPFRPGWISASIDWKPGGSVWILDFWNGGTKGLHGWLARVVSHQHGDEDVMRELPTLLKAAGFVGAEGRSWRNSRLGPLALTHAHVPREDA